MEDKWQIDWQAYPESLHEEVASIVAHLQQNTILRDTIENRDQPPRDDWIRVMLASDYVRNRVLQHPEQAIKMIVQVGSSIDKTDFFSSFRKACEASSDKAALSRELREYRGQFMLHTIWRDLAGYARVNEIITSLSRFADNCIRIAVNKLTSWQAESVGIQPRDANGQVANLIVLALGKLGGHELNLSSDIDLICCYPSISQFEADALSANEYFTEITQQLNHVLSHRDANGFVFRVDYRLRPFGDSGPLVMSISAMEQYYQEHGREWERYALIKARPVTGRVDETQHLMQMLGQFVYRRYIDYAVIVSLREMKDKITQEVMLKNYQENIKVGPGGIREIEFVVQAYQLLYAGKIKPLRQRELQIAMQQLVHNQLMSTEDVKILQQAYIFLRRVEHCLQAYRDEQTQRLPDSAVEQSRLAFAMQYADWSSFLSDLHLHRSKVDAIFAGLAQPSQENDSDEVLVDLALVWDMRTDEQSALSLLEKHGIDETKRVLQLLCDFHRQCERKKISKIAWERLDTVLPMLLREVATIDSVATTLIRLLDILQQVIRRSSYLLLLIENPLAIRHCVQLCASSAWFSQQLSKYPMLFDEFLDLSNYYELSSAQDLKVLLQDSLLGAEGDIETQMQLLRQFKKATALRIAAAEIKKILPLMQASDKLSELAELMLEEVYHIAWRDTLEKYRDDLLEPNMAPPPMAIIAYGKFAGYELSYNSDLDVIFLYDKAKSLQHVHADETFLLELYSRWVYRIIHLMQTMTQSGNLYTLDTRLRPSGEAGMLICSLDAFLSYQSQQAWIWEHQALVRSRVVVGSAAMKKRYQALRQTVLSVKHAPATLKQEVCAMRNKMLQQLQVSSNQFDLKLSQGGMTDIEFIVQYWVLRYANVHDALLQFPDNVRIIETAVQETLITADIAKTLIDTYVFYREKSHLLDLQNQANTVAVDDVLQQKDAIIEIWQSVFT